MPLEIGYLVGAKAGHVIGARQRQHLSFTDGSGQPALAIARDPIAADHRVNVSLRGFGVGFAHEDQKTRSFAGPKTLRFGVIGTHVLARERTIAGKADEFERVEAQIDSAGERGIDFTEDEAAARRRDGEQGGCAGAVDGITPAGQVEIVANAAGDDVGQATRQAVLVGWGKWRFVGILQ